MRILLALLVCITCVSCAEYKGATYSGNGDAGGGKLTEYSARTFMTDLKAGSFTARKAVVSGQNQTKVPLAIVRTIGTVAAASITANLSEAISSNGSHEVINASNNAAAIAAEKEATKRAALLVPKAP